MFALLLAGFVFAGNDLDGDAWAEPEDCDDTDAAVHPEAYDAWYDGVDADCAGNDDFDQDGDGAESDLYGGEDCDDLHASVRPDAEDVFYDGVDADCTGNDDYDADGDGFQSDIYGGDDCDDHEYTSHPGAKDQPYDNVDADCGDDDDFDWDDDGFVSSRFGGDDCDDENPEVHPGAADIVNDRVDQDCDGHAATQKHERPASEDAGCLGGSASALGLGMLTVAAGRRRGNWRRNGAKQA
ncbi:hypothetical protein LBMAG42_32250 [Deltaproteobacteria bacterium]|nr:hypothetical protein LBMAG42_32250 [Deltaproteobacteria bacterium]